MLCTIIFYIPPILEIPRSATGISTLITKGILFNYG